MTSATARRFGAREDTSNPPDLRIKFNVPLPPKRRITGVQRVNVGIGFRFEAQPGASYRVEHRTVAAPGTWFTLTNVALESIPRNIVVSDVPGATSRFNRVVARQTPTA